jgi:hypothetical protein
MRIYAHPPADGDQDAAADHGALACHAHFAADGDGATNGADEQARFQVEDIARYRGRVPALDPDLIDLACESYFVDL